MCVFRVKNREVGLKVQNHDSLGTVLFNLKDAWPFSWVGQNAKTKSVIKLLFYHYSLLSNMPPFHSNTLFFQLVCLLGIR